jgi:hypothetical protein
MNLQIGGQICIGWPGGLCRRLSAGARGIGGLKGWRCANQVELFALFLLSPYPRAPDMKTRVNTNKPKVSGTNGGSRAQLYSCNTIWSSTKDSTRGKASSRYAPATSIKIACIPTFVAPT